MTSFEELCARERQGVEPCQEDLDRVARRVGTAVGVGLITGVATSGTGLATVLGTAKWTQFLNAGTKSVMIWVFGASGGVGAIALAVVLFPPVQTAVPAAQTVVPPAAPALVVSGSTRGEGAQPLQDIAVSPELKTAEAPSVEATYSQNQSARVPGAVHAVQADMLHQSQAKRNDKVSTEPPTDKESRLSQDAQMLSRITAALNSGKASAALELLSRIDVRGSSLTTEFEVARAVALCEVGELAKGRQLLFRLKKSGNLAATLVRVDKACR